MLETQLKEIAGELNISIDELINRYIRRGVHVDYGFHKPKRITEEDLLRTHEKRIQKDIEKGYTPKNITLIFWLE